MSDWLSLRFSFSHYFIGGKNDVNTAVLDLGTTISQIALGMILMTRSPKSTIINLKLKYISSCQFRWYQILINKRWEKWPSDVFTKWHLKS